LEKIAKRSKKIFSFLADKISFLKIADVIENTLAKVSFIAKPTFDDYVKTDEEARNYAMKEC